MADIQSQIADARKAGYDDAAITAHLSGMPEYGAQMKTALGAGYKPNEILLHLAPAKTEMASGKMSELPDATLAMLAKPDVPAGPRVPKWGVDNPTLYGIAGAARETLGPIVQFGSGLIGGLVGGAAGVPGGPAGMIAGSTAGAGLGYSMGNQLVRAADINLGNVQSGTVGQESVNALRDIGTGALLEGGGQIAGNLLGRGVNAVRAMAPKAKAAMIARKAAGKDLPRVIDALDNAPAGATAAQAASSVYSPPTQALLASAAARKSGELTGTGAPGVTQAQALEAQRVLAEMSGGSTATAARESTDAARKGLSTELYGDVGAPILARAGVGNEVIPGLQTVAAGFPQAAGKELDDIIAMQSRIQLGQMPASAAADAAARGGKLTEEAIHAQQALQQLEAAGLRPLTVDALQAQIANIAKDPAFAGLSEMQSALNLVSRLIKSWTTADKMINPLALDSIRKNAVNSTVQRLLGNASPSAQQELAAKLTASLRPAIIEAVENAGGAGYGAYLAKYREELQNIAKQKLTAEAMRLYKDSPSQFVKLIQGESPDVVEGILGKGNYNIGKELAEDAMAKLKSIADITERGASAVGQASKGQKGYEELLTSNVARIKLPWGLSAKGAAVNKGLDILEQKVGAKIMRELAEASTSAKNYADLLRRMPADSAATVDKVMRTTNWTANALNENANNRNALARQ